MLGGAGQSPATRLVSDVSPRAARLDAFERWRVPVRVDFEQLLGKTDYDAYWRELDRVIAELEQSQTLADSVRARIAAAVGQWQVRPMENDPKPGNS